MTDFYFGLGWLAPGLQANCLSLVEPQLNPRLFSFSSNIT